MSESGVDLNTLYTALGTEYGIVLRCSDFARVRQRLYRLLRESTDPDLESLSLVQSPTSPQELWIVKKPKKDPAP